MVNIFTDQLLIIIHTAVQTRQSVSNLSPTVRQELNCNEILGEFVSINKNNYSRLPFVYLEPRGEVLN
jgi:hypothetical protein